MIMEKCPLCGEYTLSKINSGSEKKECLDKTCGYSEVENMK